MSKKIATPKSSHKSKQLHNNSVDAQRTRILAKLEEVGSKGLTTIQIRDELNCLCPAARILELRECGHAIQTLWATGNDHCGRKHRVARYVLIKRKAVAA